ncbi:hypothetical protein OR1_03570 [Geobacter sp. OR-1]|uniref:DUF3443 domain-containing protein n=1 Tax=Geobacter sp. OR-1 TaxID=1266765 RepID=UPI00054255C4|nr:DUF3443 domain-containing protein [Geobacter sp. OR-1]GAM11259.1 hypothetical protein OR1_03570 [Geobacter sp. OR-1]
MKSSKLIQLLVLSVMAGCGSGGSDSSPVVSVPPPSGTANEIAITVNRSFSAAPNTPFVSVKVCPPGSSVCQTVDHILLDTGSYGLRIFKSALNGLPLAQVTVGSASVAECIPFLDGSGVWGPVQMADVYLGGEPKVTVPIQVIDATFGSVPPVCSPPNVASLDQNPTQAGFNGILGVGLFVQDCGTGCAVSANNQVYFSCNGTACGGAAVPVASQVQNPVAHLPQDNNGVLVQLPKVPAGGMPSSSGLLVLGIGTQPNNSTTGVTTYPTSQFGDFTTQFSGISYTNSFIDSGSNGLFFNGSPSQLPPCTSNSSWFCPPATVLLSATNIGAGGAPIGSVPFAIGNAENLFRSANNVFAELGGESFGGFDWGLPFFLGRKVFVGIEGKSSGLGNGPYWAY